MEAPGPHPQERERLAELLALDILDTPPDAKLDRIVRVAARLFGVPVSAVSLIDRNRQWFKSYCGVDVNETSREVSFCGHAILGEGVLCVPDATADPRFRDNPLVVGPMGLRFYAGVPVHSRSGLPLGTLCVIGLTAKEPTEWELESLRDLGIVVEGLLQSEADDRRRSHGREAVTASLTAVLGSMAEAVLFLNAQGRWVSANPVADELPESVVRLLTQRIDASDGTKIIDEQGRRVRTDELPHQVALATGMSQPRRIIGVREAGAPEPSWYEIRGDVIRSEDSLVGVACSLLNVTVHQRVVQALRMSEQRLVAMATNVPGVIYQFRTYPDGRVSFPYISPGIERLYGVTAETWTNDPDWAIRAICDEDKESYASAFVAAMASLSRFDWEGRTHTARPGEVIWIHCQSLPIEEPEGTVLWCGVVSDITASKRQAEALRKSEERFRIVVEQTYQMIYDIDVATGETVWDGATWALAGRTIAEMGELSLGGWLNLVHPSDRAMVQQAVARSTNHDEPFSVRYRFARADGRYIWVHDRGTYLRGQRGRPVRMLGTMSDVTAEIDAMQQAAENQRRAEALIAAMQDTVIRVGLDGTILDVRHLPEWQVEGVAPQASVHTLRDLLPEHLAWECLGHVRSVVERRSPERCEARLEHGSQHHDLEIRLSPSGPDEVVMVLRDVSEQREVERLKSQFVSTVSHELRTPLASVRGALGLIAAGVAGELAPMVKELSELALENAKRLERLINDLLDLESSDTGQLRLECEICDISQLLAKALRAVSPFAASYGIDLRFDAAIAEANCRVDADRLGQVITNLLSNAIKHSASESAVVMRLLEAGEHFRIEVENSGSDIPDNFRSRIFQRFAMADATDSRKRGGTGLGLAIAKALVERMQGRINYSSKDGTTLFFVELPRDGTCEEEADVFGSDGQRERPWPCA